ncbi:MAG: hypothetical protein AB7O80_21430 [Acetobacteraceae bacterium]
MQPEAHLRWPAGLAYAGIPVLLVIALGAKRIGPVLSGELINPDSYMRLVRLHEAAQTSTYAHVVTRDASGSGTLVHWSHLLDSILCLLALPLSILVDSDVALRVAAIIFGPLCLAGLGLAAAWAAAPFAHRSWLWLAPVVATFGHAILAYGLPGVVHHHVPTVIIAVMTGGWAARLVIGTTDRWAGSRLGGWAALGLWLTPETLPLSVMAFGALWVSWITTAERRDLAVAIRDAGIAFLVIAGLAYLVDPPYGGYAAEDLDRLSAVFIGLAIGLAATGLIVAAVDEMTAAPAWRLGLSLSSGVMIAVLWILLFPSVLQGTHHIMSEADWRAMFSDIGEMQPVKSVAQWLQYLLTGTLGAVALAVLAARKRNPTLGFVTLCAIVLIALGWKHIRFASYPEALGAVMLPIIVTLWNNATADWSPSRQSLPRVAMILTFVLIPFASEMPQPFRTAKADPAAAYPSCSVSGLGPMLAPMKDKVVLANVNNSPELLYRTGVLTVGSLYHRNPAAFMRLRSAWRTQAADAVPKAFTVANISYVLFCPAEHRSPLVKDLPKMTLWDRLEENQPPSWLRKVAQDPLSGNTLYRVGS